MRNFSGSAKRAYAPHVKKIVDMLYQKYGLHHNDIRWKNLTYKNYKITVIDWENASTENLDLNHDNIL
jgi:thiamine kinase-like enzyme